MKLISATILENTSSHFIVELTISSRKTIFHKPEEEKVKVYKNKDATFWDAFDKRRISFADGYALNAFVSTGKQSITF